ncbi:MAG TPA: hypothetical protein VNA69_10290, partial [Thermoanaerobaculia bacterium]|nr:hypothetical protein [Thermoanaerobaculia bacterium]
MTVKATDLFGRVAGPVMVGSVPFGTATETMPVSIAGDTGFRARTVKVEGTTAVVGSWAPYSPESGNIVVYDVSGPTPVERRVIAVNNPIRDFELVNGWLYIASHLFSTIDLNTSGSTLNHAQDRNGTDQAVAVANGFAYTAENFNSDGRIHVWDVSNRAAPRFLATHITASSGNTIYTDLIAYGDHYLLGISNGASGRDLTVIDRRDPDNLRRVGELQIPEITAFRGRLIGTTLYLAGQEGGVATVDVSNPAAPQMISSMDTPGLAFGIDAAGSTVIVADRGAGVTFFDNTTGSLVYTGTHATGGDAWDVALGNGHLYVATSAALTTVRNVVAPPRIDTNLIAVARDGTVTGTAGAITGQAPLQVQVQNAITAAAVTVPVSGDGSFTALVPAAPGQLLIVRASDGAARLAGPVNAGHVPFGTATETTRIAVSDDANFRARSLKIEGNTAVVGSWAPYNPESSRLVVFDLSGASPVESRVVTAPSSVRDFEIAGGWLYIASDRLSTIDLSAAGSTINHALDRSGTDQAVTVANGFAYTAENFNSDGRIHVWDVTNPATPQFLSTQITASSGNTIYTDLIPLGTQHLIGISSGASGRDVTIIDRSNPAALVRVGELQVLEIVAFRGRLSGTTLFLAGQEGGVAMIDVSNPASPQKISVLDTPGLAFGVETSGSTVIVADRGAGLAFLNTASGALTLIGSHVTNGDAWDVLLRGDDALVATSIGLTVVKQARPLE